MTESERIYMLAAISQAQQSLPEDRRIHPKVGVVAVKDEVVLALAYRGEIEAGEHAEFTALEKKLKSKSLAGATLYTTLEPCTTRKHPKVPCADRIIERKISRVVIGMLDPNEGIRGRGVQRLRQANIEISLFPHDLMAQVEEQNREFMRHHKEKSMRSNEVDEEPFTPYIRTENGFRFNDLLRTKEHDRVFGLFSEEVYQICPITVGHIIKSCITSKDSCNADTLLCIRRIIDLLEKDKGLKNIDYSHITNSLNALQELKDKWIPCLKERDRFLSLRYPKPTYKGTIPPAGVPKDIILGWASMTKLAKKLLHDTFLSPYRIVLSYSNMNYMTITSTHVSKEKIIPCLQTPVIERKEHEPSHYYGMPDYGPSSEAIPHLKIHQYLEQKSKESVSAIIHCHPVVILVWLELDLKHADLLPEDGILDYIPFGTSELGMKLGETLCRKRSALVREHGVWTAGKSFDDAYINFISLFADIRRLTGGDLACLELQEK